MLEWRSQTPLKVVVVCLHGLGLCARAYKPLADKLSQAGIDGFGVNVRGFGPDRSNPEHSRLDCVKTVGDVRELLKNIRKAQPESRLFIMGESMGGALAIRIAAENPELVDGVICSAPAWKLLKMRRTAAKGVLELVFFPNKRPGPAGRGVMRQATSDPELTDHWLQDSSHKLKLSLKEATAFLSFISKTDDYARKLNMPTLVLQGLQDKLVSPKAVARIFRDVPANKKSFLIDATGEHLVLEEGRFSPALLESVISWMKTDLKSRPIQRNFEIVNHESLSRRNQRHLRLLTRLAEPSFCRRGRRDLPIVRDGSDLKGKIDLQH